MPSSRHALLALLLLLLLTTSACQQLRQGCQVLVHRDGTLTAIRHYGTDGRLREIETLDSPSLRAFVWSPRGELQWVRYSSEVQSFVPPPLGVEAFADPFERSDVRFDYDDDGRLLSASRTDVSRPDNTALGSIPEADADRTLTELYSYDDQGRLLQIRVVTDPTRQLEPRLALEVDRSVPDRLTFSRIGPDGLPTEKITLVYQGQRLLQRQVATCTRKGNDADCKDLTWYAYSYDEAGHLTAITRDRAPHLTLEWEGDHLLSVRQGEGEQPDRLDTYTWDSKSRVTSRHTIDRAAEAWNKRRPVTGEGDFGGLAREAAKQTRFEEGYIYTAPCANVPITDLAPDPTRRFIEPDFERIGDELDMARTW